MSVKVLSISDWCYQALLRAYPRRFRRRFGVEMGQVFRSSCRSAYRTAGTGGVMRLWLPALWDWTLTAIREQVSSLLGKEWGMDDTRIFDRQLGDMVWMMSMGLLAGYSLEMVFEVLSKEVPEPSRSVFKRVYDDLCSGTGLETALANLQKAMPSRLLGKVIEVIQTKQKVGGNLGEMLLVSVERLIQLGGSDPADYAPMRKLAWQVGAPLPDRAREAEQESSEAERDYGVNDIAALDRQLGDAVWMLFSTYLTDEIWLKFGELRTDYALYRAVYQVSLETPEPTRSVFKQLDQDIVTGMGIKAAFTNLRNDVPSRLVSELVGVILEQQEHGGNTGLMLKPLVEKFIQEAGSDPAMYPAMRSLAKLLDVPVPDRAK